MGKHSRKNLYKIKNDYCLGILIGLIQELHKIITGRKGKSEWKTLLERIEIVKLVSLSSS